MKPAGPTGDPVLFWSGMRLFVGIALAPEASAAVAAVRDRFAAAGGDLRWPAPEGWHVTLQFLGQVSDEQLSCLTVRLGEIRAERVPVKIEGLGFFERAGVFFAGVPLTPELLALQQFVTAANRRCGFVPESRPWHPHITLARTKGRSGGQALLPLKKVVERSGVALEARFTAGEFLLYESFAGPEGSQYEVRARFALGNEH